MVQSTCKQPGVLHTKDVRNNMTTSKSSRLQKWLAGDKEGGLGGGQMSPSSAAAQGDAGDDRGGKPDKTGKASGKTSNEDDTNTSTVGGTQTKKGRVGAGAPSDIGRG